MTYICSACRKRTAIWFLHGQVQADRSHDLCLQCWRNRKESEKQKEMLMAQDTNRGVSEQGVAHHFGVPVTDDPRTVKELLALVRRLEARVFELENQKPTEQPAQPGDGA